MRTRDPDGLHELVAEHLGSDAGRYDIPAVAMEIRERYGAVCDLRMVDPTALRETVARHERPVPSWYAPPVV